MHRNPCPNKELEQTRWDEHGQGRRPTPTLIYTWCGEFRPDGTLYRCPEWRKETIEVNR